MIKPVFLWTDIMIFVLVAAVAGFVLYAGKREHLRAPWRNVFRNRVGVVSLIVLLLYVTIALLDSLHFRLPLENNSNPGARYYSVDVLSVLDVLVMPVKEHVEKTYSEPFATHLYAKETVDMPDGGQQRIYPRLQYGGAHLTDPAQRQADLAGKVMAGLVSGLVLSALLISLVLFYLARRRQTTVTMMWQRIWRREEAVPWRALLLSLAAIVLIIAILAMLAGDYHILGTDKVGQDVFYQAIKSIRTALAIGTLTTLIMLPFAILLGIMAGYFRGWIDDVIQYLYTTLNSIPGVLLIAAAVLMLQVFIGTHPEMFPTDAERADMRLLFLCLILGVTSWTGLCRMLRAETLKLREVEYIQAAAAFGVRNRKVIIRHILPNVMHIVLISVVLDFSGLVLAEAVLSYVGVGVDPSMYSWGNMINSARLEMAREPMVWWSLVAAFCLMFILVLAANLFSDAVRDAFDPRIRSA